MMILKRAGMALALLAPAAVVTFAAAAAAAAEAAVQAPLKLVIIAVPPMGITDSAGHPGGIQADIASGLQRECATRIDVSIVPNPRAMLMIGTGEADLIFAIESPALAQLAKPLEWTFRTDVIVFGRAGTEFHSRADLRGKTLGHLRGTLYDTEVAVDSAIGEYETATSTQAIAMLLEGRYDGVLGIRPTLFYAIDAMHVPRSKLGPVLLLRQTESWLHYSLKRYNPVTAARLQACIASMRRRGDIEAILQRYLGTVPMR